MIKKSFCFAGVSATMFCLIGAIALNSVQAETINHGQNESVTRFVVLADSRGNDHGINLAIVRKTLARIKTLSPQPEFAVIPGDLVNGSKLKDHFKAQLEFFKKTVTGYYPLSFFYVGIGNHEVFSDDAENTFSSVFPEHPGQKLRGYHGTVYCWVFGPTKFFMLNTNHPGETHTISTNQLAWVKEHIDQSRKHHLFFMHEPSYPTGYHIGESQDIDPYRRNELWHLFDSANGSMVFCGHEHFYSRRHIDDIYNETVKGKQFTYDKKVFQVTIGGFGAPLSGHFDNKPGVDVPPIAQYHFAVVDAAPDSVRVTVYNLDGKVLDKFSD